ncbi:hypothetical protein ACFW04_005204 [Cataglyphis niger]
MKLLLITFVICFAAALAAPADKPKREILPGDPRYGTDYHHHHHQHHEHENEVQISKAAGGYVGSVTVPEETEGHSFQVQSLTAYGPPNYKPGKPLGPDYSTSSDTVQNSVVQVPATSYGIPDTQINNYVEPATDDKSNAVKTNLNVDYQAPSVEAPITSYVAQQEEHLPQTSYETSVKTNIQSQPQVETLQVKSAVPEVHHEVQHVQPAVVHKETASVPQVKTTTSHVETQGAQHSLSSLPSYTSSFDSFPNYFYSSYPSYGNIPVRTVDHRVHVQVPQPYPVPVTKHVTYPVPVPHAVEVPKPYYVRVAQPVQVTVNRPYAVEVPRPVAYPVPQYYRTNVPVVQQQHINTLDTSRIRTPINNKGFFEDVQSTFGSAISNLPSFQNPLENFQNPFQNFELPSFISSFNPLPSFPQVTPAPSSNSNVQAASSDSIIIENPALKTETTVTKTAQPVVTHHARLHQTTHSGVKPTTTCAGCSVSATHITKQHVLPTDTNGYNY